MATDVALSNAGPQSPSMSSYPVTLLGEVVMRATDILTVLHVLYYYNTRTAAGIETVVLSQLAQYRSVPNRCRKGWEDILCRTETRRAAGWSVCPHRFVTAAA